MAIVTHRGDGGKPSLPSMHDLCHTTGTKVLVLSIAGVTNEKKLVIRLEQLR